MSIKCKEQTEACNRLFKDSYSIQMSPNRRHQLKIRTYKSMGYGYDN